MSNVIPMPRLEIRPARKEDLDAVSQMVVGVWREIYGRYLPTGSADHGGDMDMSELIGDSAKNGWVAVLGKRIVGYCSITGNCIEQIWVGAEMRRRGIGTELTRQAVDALRARGFAFAQMGCEDFNTGALAFLEAGNWACIGSEARSMANGRKYRALVYSRSVG